MSRLTKQIEEAIKSFQPDPDAPGVYEYASEEYLTLEELKEFNRQGWAYQTEQTEIDFEDINEKGELITDYYNLYYFRKI
jgi:hypothetical protein